MRIEVRPSSAQDLPRLAEIESVSEYSAHWGEKGLSEEMARTDGIVLTVLADGAPAGFAAGRAVAGCASLYDVAVAPENRRAGLGGALVRAFAAAAARAGCGMIELEVNASNAPALRLYEKCGFAVVGRRPKFYNLTDDAILMDMELR